MRSIDAKDKQQMIATLQDAAESCIELVTVIRGLAARAAASADPAQLSAFYAATVGVEGGICDAQEALAGAGMPPPRYVAAAEEEKRRMEAAAQRGAAHRKQREEDLDS